MSKIKTTGTKVIDRRIRKTRAALKGSLNSLMKRKKIKDISVSELTDLANINRGTFYLHYKDVFDLLEQSEEDLLEKFRNTLESFSPESISESPSKIFEEVYKLCLENSGLVKILIGENGDIKFLNKLKKLLRDKCLRDWSSLMKTKQKQHFDAYYAFIVGGCINLLQYWFQNGMKETPKELSIITIEIIDGSISVK